MDARLNTIAYHLRMASAATAALLKAAAVVTPPPAQAPPPAANVDPEPKTPPTINGPLFRHSVKENPEAKNFWRRTDPSLFIAARYVGVKVKEMYGPDTEGTGKLSREAHVFNCTFADGTACDINVSTLFGDEAAARYYATEVGYAHGQMPLVHRAHSFGFNLHFKGDAANAESLAHFVTLSKSILDARIAAGILPCTVFHENNHAVMQEQSPNGKGFRYLGEPFRVPPRIEQPWLDAVKVDLSYPTEYAKRNAGEDFSESMLLLYVAQHRPDRMTGATRAWLKKACAARLAYLQTVVYPTP